MKKEDVQSVLRDIQQKHNPIVSIDDSSKSGIFRLRIGQSDKVVMMNAFVSNGKFQASLEIPKWAKDAIPQKDGDSSIHVVQRNGSSKVSISNHDYKKFFRIADDMVSRIIQSMTGNSIPIQSEVAVGIHRSDSLGGNVRSIPFDFWGNGAGKYLYVMTSPVSIEAIGPIPQNVSHVLLKESWTVLGVVCANSRQDALKQTVDDIHESISPHLLLTVNHGAINVISEQSSFLFSHKPNKKQDVETSDVAGKIYRFGEVLVRYSLMDDKWVIHRGIVIEGEEDTLDKAITKAKSLEGASSKAEETEPDIPPVDTTSPIPMVPGMNPEDMPSGGSSGPSLSSLPGPEMSAPPPPMPTSEPPMSGSDVGGLGTPSDIGGSETGGIPPETP